MRCGANNQLFGSNLYIHRYLQMQNSEESEKMAGQLTRLRDAISVVSGKQSILMSKVHFIIFMNTA